MSAFQPTSIELGKDSEGNWALELLQSVTPSDAVAIVALVHRWWEAAGQAGVAAFDRVEEDSVDQPEMS